MARRLSSPVFVGRTNELNALLSTAGIAASGQAAVALVGGEAGVGKSRLAAEVGERLRARGWLVLEGGSVALGDDSLPFGPIIEALRALVHVVDAEHIMAAAGPSLPELARLVPELSSGVEPAPTPVGDAEWLRIRIFESVLRLLGGLGETAPVLLIVEDLHWSDRSTRDLLAFLARNARSERLMIIATTRTDELRQRHPMTSWLAEAERQSRIERIDLARFERPEITELLNGIAGAPPTASVAESIARRSGGNAFFAEELLAAIREPGLSRQRLPETLRGVVLVRLAAISESATRLIEIAAVAGRQVDHDLLADVCGLSEDDLRAALHELIDAQLLVVDLELYEFRHALVQEVVYGELLPSERRDLHAAYARAVDARPTGRGAAAASHLAELAYHWTAANELTPGFAAAIAAGDALAAVYAYAEAGREYERAIALWDVVPADDRPPGRDLGDLYDAASAAAIAVGDVAHAVDLAKRAAELIDSVAGPHGGRERRARARERLSNAVWLAGDTKSSLHLLEEAVDLLQGAPQSSGQASILAGLAVALWQAGRLDDAVPIAKRALDGARTIGDRRDESRALEILGIVLAERGNIAAGIDLLRQCLDIAIQEDDPTVLPWVYTAFGGVLASGGLVEEALEVSLAGLERSQKFGIDITALQDNVAEFMIQRGRYAEAADLLDRYVSHGRIGRAHLHIHFTRAHLALRTGDLPIAKRELEIARANVSGIADAHTVSDLHMLATEIELWDGDPVAALGIAREGFAQLVDKGDHPELGWLLIPAVCAAADVAVRARAARDASGLDTAVNVARDVIARYWASTRDLTEPDALANNEIGWRMALGAAELGRAEAHDDPANWDAILPTLRTRTAPFLEAYVLWRKAEAQAERGEPRAAVQPLREARTIAVAIGAPLLLARIEAFGQRLRIEFVSPDVRPTRTAKPAPPTLAESFKLTRREREVLPLVAKGYTNGRIAETLFISESTAGVHVSNILGKLGVDTRTEAAAVAVRLGLDRAPTPS